MVDDGALADLRRDAERYREAAEAALDQLEWCIGYFHRIRRSDIATGLARNTKVIRGGLNR